MPFTFLWTASGKILKATFHYCSFFAYSLNNMKRFWSTTSIDLNKTTIFQRRSIANLINTAITRKMFLFALASFTSGPMNTNLKNTSNLFCCEINFFCSEFYFQNGCSVRLLNPQTYSRNVWKLLSVLQEYFNCCVGANV